MTDFATPLYYILQLAKSLQSATSVQNATPYFITKCDSFFVTKGDKCYYKVRQVLQSATILFQSAIEQWSHQLWDLSPGSSVES